MSNVAFDLNNVEAIYEGAQDREELGLLVWYMFWDQPVDRPMLEDAFKRAGLDEKWLPQPIQIADVFRRMTSIRRKKLPIEDMAEVFANYYVTEVSSTKEQIVRILVKDIVDSGNVMLSHEDVGMLVLVRDKKSIEFEQYGDIDKDILEYIYDLKNNFAYYSRFYNGKIIRELVRKILSTTNTVPLKDHGGVYFVPRQHKELVYSLQKMVEILQEQNPDKSKISSIKAVTLMNKAQEKVIIKETIEEHVREKTGKLNNLIAELAKALQNNGKVKRKDVENYLDEAKRLVMTVREYEVLLEDDLRNIRTGVEILKTQLSEMLSRVSE